MNCISLNPKTNHSETDLKLHTIHEKDVMSCSHLWIIFLALGVSATTSSRHTTIASGSWLASSHSPSTKLLPPSVPNRAPRSRSFLFLRLYVQVLAPNAEGFLGFYEPVHRIWRIKDHESKVFGVHTDISNRLILLESLSDFWLCCLMGKTTNKDLTGIRGVPAAIGISRPLLGFPGRAQASISKPLSWSPYLVARDWSRWGWFREISTSSSVLPWLTLRKSLRSWHRLEMDAHYNYKQQDALILEAVWLVLYTNSYELVRY